jgi:hypothetical protein
VSDFSVHSGEPELEFDLYDCDLDNVMRAPGSMFAPAYWDGEEEEEEAMTPTLGLEMVQLFPREDDEPTEVEEEIVCRMKKRDQVPLFILYFPEQTSSVRRNSESTPEPTTRAVQGSTVLRYFW